MFLTFELFLYVYLDYILVDKRFYYILDITICTTIYTVQSLHTFQL